LKVSFLTDLPFRIFWQARALKNAPGQFRNLKALRKWEQAGTGELGRFQLARINELLIHARQKSPYYAEALKDFPLEKDLRWEGFRDLPVLSKKIIQENGERMLTGEPSIVDPGRDFTGGSTGEPLVFYRDREFLPWFEACDRFVKGWWGIAPWDRKAYLWGADRDMPKIRGIPRLKQTLERRIFLDSFRMTPEGMDEFADELTRFRPKYIQGYASSLAAFGAFLEETGRKIPQPKAIRSTAETLFPEQRKLIEKFFGGPVHNFYGSREIISIATECPEHSGLHVLSPIRYVEILDEEGHPVGEGEAGRIVVTDLINYTMPFIRYDTGDVGVFTKKMCPCGRSFPLIREVKGRVSDLIRTKSGTVIHGEFFTHLFYGIESISGFQVRQTALDKLEISVVERSPVPQETLDRIRGKITEQMGKETVIEIKSVETIPNTRTEKRRFTICEIE